MTRSDDFTLNLIADMTAGWYVFHSSACLQILWVLKSHCSLYEEDAILVIFEGEQVAKMANTSLDASAKVTIDSGPPWFKTAFEASMNGVVGDRGFCSGSLPELPIAIDQHWCGAS